MNFWNNAVEWVTENSQEIWDSFMNWATGAGVKIAVALLILLIGLWLSNVLAKGITRMIKSTKVDKAAGGFVCSCLRVIFKIIVIVAAIARLGLNVTSIVTALGAAGVTIGLAMQDSLSNIASGVLILFNKPFKLGDFIEVDGVTGTVRSIELTYTSLLTVENKEMIVPNSRMIDNSIINYTAEPLRRLDMQFPLPYDSDIALVKRILLEAAKESSYIDQTKETVVGIMTLSNSSVVYELRSWIDCNKYWDAYFELQELALVKFRENGIEIPFDQLDVHMK